MPARNLAEYSLYPLQFFDSCPTLLHSDIVVRCVRAPSWCDRCGFGRVPKECMFSQNEIDAVLQDAQSAVDDLTRDVGGMSGMSGGSAASSVAAVSGRSTKKNVRSASDNSATAPSVRRILRLKVPVRVRLANKQMAVGDILKIAPGSIVEFDQSVEEDLSLMVNNRQIGCGVAVKINEHFGLRITSIGDVQSRINSLGQ